RRRRLSPALPSDRTPRRHARDASFRRASPRPEDRASRGPRGARAPLDRRAPVRDELPELLELGRLIERLGPSARVERLASVPDEGGAHPILGVSLGAEDPRAPAILFVGGVHGLERIGTEVVLAHLGHLAERLRWDRSTHR